MQEDDILSEIIKQDTMMSVRENIINNVGVNPDKEAELQRKAKAAGVSPAEARVSSLDLDRALVEKYASGVDLPLATRKLLADSELSRLVATTPQAYESLSTVDQLASRIGRGFAMGDVADATRTVEAVKSPLADYDVEGEGDGADFSFLEEYAKKEDSVLMQDAQDRIKQASYDLVEANAAMRQYTTPMAMQEVADAKTFGEALGVALQNPVDVMLGTALESTAAMGWALPVTAAAYAVNPVLGAASMGISSYGLEFGNTLNEALIEAGVDTLDPVAIREALSNPDIINPAIDKAKARASSVATFDTVAGLVAPIRLSPATNAIAYARYARKALTGTKTTVAENVASVSAKRTPLMREMENLVAQATVGGVLGGAGEAVGQLSADGEITSIGDIVLEAVADLASAPVDVLMARADARKLVEQDRVASMKAKQDAQIITEVLARSKVDGLNARDPKTYQDFLDDAQLQGISELSANVQTLKELGVYDKLLAAAPRLRAQAALAEAAGGDLPLKLGDLSALNDADPNAANTVVSAVRTSPEGMSLLEAQEYDTNAGTKLSETANKLINDEAKAIAEDASLRAEVKAATANLDASVRKIFKAEEADAVMSLQRSIVYRLASTLGVKPERLMQVYGKRLSLDVSARSKTNDRALGLFTPSSALVTVFKSGDTRTFMHEMAHFWLESVTEIAAELANSADSGAQQASETINTIDEIMVWLGAKGNSVTERISYFKNAKDKELVRMHEKFAEGFEVYLTEGNAPSEGLARAFEMVKQWVIDSWKFFGKKRDALSPEVLALYDSLFFADQEAAQVASELNNVSEARAAVLKGAMTEAEYLAYLGLTKLAVGEAATQISASMQRNKKLINSRREREKRGLEQEYKRILKEEREKVKTSKPYQTLAALTGKRDDGIKFRLSEAAAKQELSEEAYALAKKRGWIRQTGDNLLSPSDAAELLGYSSPAEFIDDALLAAQIPVDDMAKPAADKRFLEQHGEAATEKGMTRLASDAAYNSTRLLVVASEFRALKKMTTPIRPIIDMANAFAMSVLGSKRLFSINPSVYQRAAIRARKATDRALAKGELTQAAEFVRAEMLQTALAKQAASVRSMAAKFHKNIAQAVRSETIDFGHRDQIINIAAVLGLVSPSRAKFVEKAPRIDIFFQGTAMEQEATQCAEIMASGKTAKELTVNEYKTVMSVVTALIKRGREAHKAEVSEAKASVNARKAEMTEKITSTAKTMGRKARESLLTETRPWMKAKDRFVGFFQSHVKMSTWARIFDGNTFGPWFENIIKPANRLADREATRMAEITKKVDAILKPFFAGTPHGDNVTVDGVQYNLQQRFVIALNAGNKVNLARLERGNKLSYAQVQAIMGTLTDEQLAAVQQIWDLFESFKPEIAAIEYRENGKEPTWTEPTEIIAVRSNKQTVRLRGGHFPISYDYTAPSAAGSAIARDMDTAERVALEGGFTGTTTNRTYVKERSQNGLGVPLRLELTPMFDKLTEIVHDLTWREFLRDMQRLRADSRDAEGNVVPGIMTTVSKYYGANVAKQFDYWLQNIAYGNRRPPSGSMDAYASRLRRGVSIAGLGFNIVSALVQITGLIPAMTRIGIGGAASAVSDYFAHPKDNAVAIAAKSEFMANRTRTFLRELDEINNRIEGGQGKVAKGLRGVQDAAYCFMSYVQGHIDRIVWLGAYKKALLSGASEADCIAQADQTVRDTQGSGLLSDMSAAEMGSVAKLFTSFYSFMNTAYNLNAAALLGEKDRVKATANILTVSVALPVIEGVLRSALSPGDDEDEDKDWLDYSRKIAGDVVGFNLGLVVGVREFSSMAGNFVAGEPVYTWRGPSSLRVISDWGQVIGQTAQGEFDKALVKSLINATGSTFAFPAAQVNRFVDGFDAYVIEERTTDPTVLVRGYSAK